MKWQTEKDKYYRVPLICGISKKKNNNVMDKQNRNWLTDPENKRRAAGREEGRDAGRKR